MKAVYRIRINSQLESYRAHWFGDVTITNLESGQAELVGLVEDQAALHHLLNKLRDLNIGLISVERLEDQPE